MPIPPPDPDPRRLWVSDLADGRLDADALARGCRDWAADEEARRAWHADHLIGDVLRSDELARPPAADLALLVALRRRLTSEVGNDGRPRVVALEDARSGATAFRPARRRRRWGGAVAIAAGFVAVAGVTTVIRSGDDDLGASPQVIAGPTAPSEGGVARPWRASVESTTAVEPSASSSVAAPMLRDVRLDAYLRAHREALAGSPAALPGGALRSVDFDAAAGR
jgi:sigma-E factor negative regulatory protein RseA